MKTYNVWLTKYGSSAKNAAIIGGTQHTRSSWVTGKLERIPVNDGTQENYRFEARDDNQAFDVLTKLYSAAHPHDRRPLSGRSYIRQCRQGGN
jgi:hypothetical protein